MPNFISDVQLVGSSTDLSLQDGGQIKLGTDNDLKIYHNNSGNSLIQNFGGNLEIRQAADDGDIIFYNDDGSGGITSYMKIDGGSERIQFNKDIRVIDDIQVQVGSSNDLKLYHNGTSSFIQNTTGDLSIENSTNDGNITFVSDDGTGGSATYIRIDGGTTESVFLKDARFLDNIKAKFGSSSDLEIYHNSSGGDGIIKNNTGDLYIENTADDKDIIFMSDNGSGGTEVYFELQGISGGANPFTVFPDNSYAVFGSGHDLRLFHNGTNSYVENANSGDLYIQQAVDDKDIIFRNDDGSGGLTTYFYLDGSAGRNVASKEINYIDNVYATFGTGRDLRLINDGSNSFFESYNHNLYIDQNFDDGDIVFRNDNGSGGKTTYMTIDGGDELIKFSKGTKHSDNVKAVFGNGSDLQIYHNATNSFIENETGNLYIFNKQDDGDIIFSNDNGSGGTTEYMRLDGSDRAIYVSAALGMYFGDGTAARFGDSGDLQIYHDNSNSIIKDSGTGDLYLMASSMVRLTNVGASEHYAKFIENGAVELYYDNTKKFETTSAGTLTSGTSEAARFIATDGNMLQLHVSTWNTGNTDHYVLYNGWRAGTGDHLIVKSSGNQSSGNGAIMISDGNSGRVYFGLHGNQQSGIDSSTAPLATTYAYVGGSANYFSANTTITGTISNSQFTIPNTAGSAGQVLKWPSSGTTLEWANPGGGVDGTGTANDIAMWADSDTLTDAPIAISGNNAAFAGNIEMAANAVFTQFIKSYSSVRIDIDNDNNQTDRAFIVSQHNAGNELFRVQENGKVGIGVAAPAAKIHVHESTNLGGTAGNNLLLRRLSNSGGSSGNNVRVNEWAYRDTANNDWTSWRYHNAISVDSSYGTPNTDTRTFWERDPHSQQQYFGTANQIAFQINAGADVRAKLIYDYDDTGYYLNPSSITNLNTLKAVNVSIETGSPILTLKDTTDNDDHKIQFMNNGGNVDYLIQTQDFTTGGGGDGLYIGSTSANEVAFVTNNTTRLTIDDSGNIGVNNTSPLYKMDVNGTLGVRNGQIQTNGSTTSFNFLAGSGAKGAKVGFLLAANNYSGTPASGVIQAQTSVIAPIFYDSNDTNYYIDPNSTGTSLKVAGNIEHKGLTMTDGADIDQLKTFNMTFQLAADTWTDTGINGSDLASGTYAMQVFVDDWGAGGGHYDEIYSAMISWHGGSTNSGNVDEIVIHRAGHASNNSDVQFRTQRHAATVGDNLMLQVKQNFAHTAAMNNTDGKMFNFKFRRLI